MRLPGVVAAVSVSVFMCLDYFVPLNLPDCGHDPLRAWSDGYWDGRKAEMAMLPAAVPVPDPLPPLWADGLEISESNPPLFSIANLETGSVITLGDGWRTQAGYVATGVYIRDVPACPVRSTWPTLSPGATADNYELVGGDR